MSYENTIDSEDIFSIHEQLLGKSLRSCIAQHSSEQTALDLNRCGLSFWRKLEPRRVAVTGTGLVGDSNMGTPYWALLGQGKTRESLVRSEEDYRFSISRQLVARAVRALTVGDRGWKGAPCEGPVA